MSSFDEVEPRLAEANRTLRLTRSGLRRVVGDMGRSSPGVIFTFRRGSDGRFTLPFTSPALERVYGVSRQELAIDALPAFRLIHPDDLPSVLRSITESADRLQAWNCEFRVNAPRHGELWVEGRSVSQREDDGSVLFYGFLNDITERKRTDLQLRRSRALLQAFIEHVPVSIAMFDRNLRYIHSSRKWQAMVGASGTELNGRRHYDDAVFLSEDRKEAHRRGLAGETVTGEGDWTGADGVVSRHYWEVHPWGDTGTETGGIIIFCQDVTYARAMESELRHAHKMEALGQLAGGVAHDFNNFLQIIQGYTEILQERFEGDEVAKKFSAEVMRAARGASSLTRQLLAFSRRQVLSMAVIDLNDVIQSTSKMLRRLLSENIEYFLDLEPSLWSIEADADQLAQVLINLCVNARDAMPHGGKLRISTRNLAVTDATTCHKLPPGEFVMLAVEDTGSGINPDIMEHIFEPFFTTKEPGKGTGLGLSTVYGIVRQSEGYVWVESATDNGARFMVCLPRTDSESLPTALHTTRVTTNGQRTILVVEDDEDVLSAVCGYLPNLGFKVLSARPKDALTLAAQYAGAIDLLLADVVMPGLNGPLLAEKIRALNPGLRTVFMSGYIDDAVTRHGVLESGAPFLQKPFTLAELADKISDALARD